MSEKKPCHRAGYRLESIDGELLLFHPARDQLIYCNETASLIWHLCDGQRTVQEIVAQLSAAFPEATEGIAEDVRDTIQRFHEYGAIRFT